MWQFPPELPEADSEDTSSPITTVVSLGSLCYTAQFMKSHKLRQWAGPFDYLFTSAAMVQHCLDSEFAAFLDQSQYVKMSGPAGRGIGHRTYSSKMIGLAHGIVFNHHDPRLADDYQHFVRAVARFEAALRSPGAKLLLLVTKQALPTADALALYRSLIDRGVCDFELLAVKLEVDRRAGLLLEDGGGGSSASTSASASGDANGSASASASGGSASSSLSPACTLLVHEEQPTSSLRVVRQTCRSGHTGLAFNDPRDAACFEQLVLTAPCRGAAEEADEPPARLGRPATRRRTFCLAPVADGVEVAAAERVHDLDRHDHPPPRSEDASEGVLDCAHHGAQEGAQEGAAVPRRPGVQRQVHTSILKQAAKAAACASWGCASGAPTAAALRRADGLPTFWAPESEAETRLVLCSLRAEAERRVAEGEGDVLRAACLVAVPAATDEAPGGATPGTSTLREPSERRYERSADMQLPPWLATYLDESVLLGFRVMLTIGRGTDVFRFWSPAAVSTAEGGGVPAVLTKTPHSRVTQPHIVLGTWNARVRAPC